MMIPKITLGTQKARLSKRSTQKDRKDIFSNPGSYQPTAVKVGC
jgi:hypothetical protein